MPTAYVLLNTEIGAETEVVRELRKVEGVESAYNLWGVYDIIAAIRADSMVGLSEIINRRIDRIRKVHSKLTMIVSDNAFSTMGK